MPQEHRAPRVGTGRDGTGGQRRVAASVPPLAGGRTERGCCLISRGRRVGHVEAFFSFSLQHGILPSSPPLWLAVAEEKVSALPFPARLSAPSGGIWDAGCFFLRKKGLRQRAAGRAPGCTSSVRAEVSLGLAMNHPARLSRKRGTAAACLAGASRRDTALRRPGLGRQPRRGGAGCRGGTARCLPAPLGAERRQRGRLGGSGRGLCPVGLVSEFLQSR